MKIRLATLRDIPSWVKTGQQFHAITRFARYEYDAAKLTENLHAGITTGQNDRGTHCFLMAEDDTGELCGILIGCVEQHLFSPQPVGSVITYVVLPDKRMSGAGLKLLTAFRKWAENRKVFELSVGVNSGVEIEKMDRFLKRLGFAKTGGNYSLALGGTGKTSTFTPTTKESTP